MSSVLKIWSTDKVESQSSGYKGYCRSIYWVVGDFIPAWTYESNDTFYSAFLEILDKKKLKNDVISVLTQTTLFVDPATGTYAGAEANGYIYAGKQAPAAPSPTTLAANTVYRLKLGFDNGEEIPFYYSDIFQKINT